jgi:hypothetical protein
MAHALMAGALVAFVVLLRCRPATAVLMVALAAAALQEGIVRLPDAVADPVAAYGRQLEDRQQRQAEALSCGLAVDGALSTEDEQALLVAEQHCPATAGR